MTRIPKQVRLDLKLTQGDRIVFEKRGQEYFIRKLIEESTNYRKEIPVWNAEIPHTDYRVADLVLGSDGKVYRLKRLGWHFLDPTSVDGRNSWEPA